MGWRAGLLGVLAWTTVTVASEPVLVPPAQQALLFQQEVRARAAELVRASAATPAAADLHLALAAVRDDPALAPAARDAVLYGYIHGLRAQPLAMIPDAALDWLADYQAQAVRLHEESAVVRVPLFDVAAAAQGLRHEKRYRLARAHWLAADPRDYGPMIAEYLAAQDRPWRGGVESAVSELSGPALSRLSELLDDDPALSLTPLAMRVHLAGGDVQGLRTSIVRADPAVASEALRRASERLAGQDAFAVAETLLGHADAGVRGLAIAIASEHAEREPALRTAWQQRLLVLLRDSADAAAVALQLARSLPVAKLTELDQAATGDPALQRRIELVRRLRADLPQLARGQEAQR